jgi:hypothetical protein
MMAAKFLVFSVVALLVGELISFATFGLGQVLIHGKAPSASLGQPLVMRAVIGAGLYLAVIGLLGSAIAVLFRQAAAGISVLVALLLVLPGVLSALPTSWSQPIERWWPTNAGQQVAFVTRDSHVVVGAFVLLQRRDV